MDQEITEAQILNEVFELMLAEAKKPDEVTAKMMMEKMNITHRAAYNRLERFTALGYLKSRKILEGGHEVNAYSPVEGGWAEVLDKLR